MLSRKGLFRCVPLVLGVAIGCVAIAGEVYAQSGKQDCIVNDTGKPVWVTLVYINQTIVTYMNPGDHFTVGVPDNPIDVVLVAYEGKGNLVTLVSFETLPQTPPPTNCLVFKAGIRVESRTRQMMQQETMGKRAAVPTFRKAVPAE